MAHRSEPRFLVLHAVRVKGFAETGDVATAAGLPGGEAEEHLRSLEELDLVRWRERPLPRWTPTPAGRTEHRRLVAEELEESGAKALVDDTYRRFLALNRELLEVCTSWQLRPGAGTPVPNDHSDPDYDRGVIERLRAVDEGVQPLVRRLAEQLERYEGYGPRLSTALERAAAGGHEWITKPMIDSYHTVWFELHEDLLATLGLERKAEEARG